MGSRQQTKICQMFLHCVQTEKKNGFRLFYVFIIETLDSLCTEFPCNKASDVTNNNKGINLSKRYSRTFFYPFKKVCS